MHKIIIEQINHEQTWKLRNEVLYPEARPDEMVMEEDISGIHFGAFEDNDLIAVISLFPGSKGSWQFRKFAVHPSMQGRGVGRRLLDYITTNAINNSASLLWCNARVSAIEFYIKSGFSHTGQFFSKNGYDYEILEKHLC